MMKTTICHLKEAAKMSMFPDADQFSSFIVLTEAVGPDGPVMWWQLRKPICLLKTTRKLKERS